jgi:enamine deaminase RidA (YjgF/YER057c/UK114 family)
VEPELYPGAPYDYTSTAGGLVFAAGACPLDAAGAVVAPGDREAQAARCVDNLLAALSTRGATTGDLLKTTIYVVADAREDLAKVWDVVAARLGRAPSTLLGVSMLGWPDQLVEIEAIASLPQQPPGA